jgi:GMP synthase (glutamine-hydrolysing)
VAEVAIVVTGEPIEPVRERRGSFATLIRETLAASELTFVELDARAELPSLRQFAAVLITGSAASVADRAPWTLAAEARVRDAVEREVPVFGICFGHQMLGQALGGAVERNPMGREIGTVSVEVRGNDSFLEPLGSRFLANMTHVDTLVRLPPGARVLARTALDPHAAVRFGERALGVQFHPEIDRDVMTAYVDARAEVIVREGLDFVGIRDAVRETPEAASLVARFLELCGLPCAISPAPPKRR